MKPLLKLLVIAGCGLFAAQAQAQAWPARTVRIVIPSSPGGGVDTVARLVATKMSENLGQPFIVENRQGAGGNIGVRAVTTAAPDGHTLLVISSAVAINPSVFKEPGYEPDDLAAVGIPAAVPMLLVTSPMLPANSLKELIAYAKGPKAPLTYAGGEQGNTITLAMELFKMMTGTQMTHVPYKSTPQKNTDVATGRVDLMFAAPPSVIPLIRAGKMKGIAVSSGKRAAALPDIPTVAEAGLADFEMVVWYGMFAPARTPAAVVTQVNRELNKVTATADYRGKLSGEGAEPMPLSPAEFSGYFKAEVAKYARLASAIGIPKE